MGMIRVQGPGYREEWWEEGCSLASDLKAKVDSLSIDDDSNQIIFQGPPETPARTTWTLLLYLTSTSDGCIGGETVFYPNQTPTRGGKSTKRDKTATSPIEVSLETGMVLLHKHGNDCMLHEGKEVLEGEKWVIRSDLCVKR